MKNLNLKVVVALVLSAALMSGCGLKKMAKKYNTVKYEATPEVLETHGGKINTAVKGVFPAKYFDKKVVVEFTPVLKWEGGSYTCKSVKVQGEKITTADGTVIKKKDGGSFNWADVIPYKPEMNASELVVNAKATKGKKTIELGEVKLADGVIYTSERVARDEDLAQAEHGYKKEVLITEKANLYFDYNSSNLSMTQKLNKEEANKVILKKVEDFIAKGWKVKTIDLNAWASPEGEEAYNAKLTEERADAAKKYVDLFIEKLDKQKAKDRNKKYEEVKREYTTNPKANGEDFEGFMASIEKSSIKEKQAIINVIKSQPDKAQREQEIKNMTVIYAEVEQILEPLRRSEITVVCYEPKRTDENIAMLSTTAPDSLKAEELLYAATLTLDENTQLNIYKSGTKTYSDNWKFWNNAGYILLKQNKLSDATPFIEKANALSPNNPVVMANMGVIASWNKDYATAKSRYEAAQSGGISMNYNLGILKIREGDYDGALSLFGSTTCRYNVALAKLLKLDNGGATTNLDCVKPQTAAVYYLKAVVGARTGNTSMMYDNLKKAIEADASYKAQAKEDREFLKYFNATDFQNIVK
jgi:outer membrane protein OmpA-like peptidoglycan-associated protein